jgi:hypothetical protein
MLRKPLPATSPQVPCASENHEARKIWVGRFGLMGDLRIARRRGTVPHSLEQLQSASESIPAPGQNRAPANPNSDWLLSGRSALLSRTASSMIDLQ